MTPYVELHCHSNFSFLDGGSHPAELAMRAAELEMPALALTDRGGVYGAVRHLQACRKLGVKPIIGSALEVDGDELILIARNLKGYSNLCRLLSLAHADQPKGEARTTLATVAEHRGDLFYLSPTDSESRLRDVQAALGKESVFSELHHHMRPEDPWILEGRAAMAKRCGAQIVATNQVHYHLPARRRLHDVLVAIRHRATLDEAREHLFPNSEHHLKGGSEMRPLFKGYEEALATPWDIAQECDVDLDFRKVRFPGYPVPAGETPFSFLYKLCFEGLRERYRPITSAVTRRLQHELEVIEKTGLAEFFLINWDLMRFAKERGGPARPTSTSTSPPNTASRSSSTSTRSTGGNGPGWFATSSPSSRGWRSGRLARRSASPPSCSTGSPKVSTAGSPKTSRTRCCGPFHLPTCARRAGSSSSSSAGR
ncbi:MAG: PHP domain-containing protein [Chloroflexi bacterium]|nr:MAG: PHP domain-containing protein [Chloroflexota bacterium]